MSSLSWALLIIAVLLIAAVLIYNWMQGQETRKRLKAGGVSTGSAFNAEVNTNAADRSNNSIKGVGLSAGALTNPLGASVRREPVIEHPAATASGLEPVAPVSVNTDGFNVPSNALDHSTSVSHSAVVFGSASEQSDAHSMDKAVHDAASGAGDGWMLRTFGLHPSADCIVEIFFDGAIAAERLIQLTQSTRRVGGKPVMFEGQTDLGDWEPLVPSESFHALRAGVLLANRNGPLNAMEFSEFVGVAQKIADQLELPVELPDMPQVLARARALDQQCAELDAQIGINVICAEALTTADLAAVALAQGLSERGNNRFALMGDHGEVLYSLSLGDAPNRLTLLLDVPRSPNAAQPWQKMVECANRCAARFAGRLVDDAEKPLPTEALNRIESQLGLRYQSLTDASFVAGSPVALRLFN
jgi:hypothetical protein